MLRIPPVRGRAAVITTVVCAVAAVPAFAAPERTGTLSAAATTYAWDGGPGNGVGQSGGTPPMGAVRCQPVVYECEDTLVELKEGGTLTVEIKAGDGSNDLDLRLFKTDSKGEVPPEENGFVEDITENKDAKVTAKNLKPGFILIRVAFFNATQGTYKGTATLTPVSTAPLPAPTVAAPAPTATPTPAAKKPSSSSAAAKRKKACVKKAKKIKNAKKRKKAIKRCNRKKRS